MDFYKIREREIKGGGLEVYPDFQVVRSKDLMIRGRSFYAIWDEKSGLWSTDEYDVQRLVDDDLDAYAQMVNERDGKYPSVRRMGDFSSNSWQQFRSYLSHLSDSSHQLDEDLTFANTEVKKNDYVSRRLPYSLGDGGYDAYDELISELYDPQERAKIEWAVGSIISGDSKDIQKFLVLYGAAGAGKSTILNIVQKLFVGYFTTFDARSITGSSNAFSTEVFRLNPLVALQHDGDLSKIEDNTKLNSIISHEDMTMNEKYKPSYTSRVNCFLFMATNKPVRITDAKSGIIRRLIDVQPSGRRLPSKRYHILMSQIDFELGGIAQHCLEVYRKMGQNYYADYRPVEMMLQTDVFYNYIESYFDLFKEQDGVTLSQAYELYKQFCEETQVDFKLPRHKFREELKNYFSGFEERAVVDDVRVRSWYFGFVTERFSSRSGEKEESYPLVMNVTESLFDELCAAQPAQLAGHNDIPQRRWDEVQTILADIDTRKVHYVRPPLNHIVIDFDLVDDEGKKSAELNIAEASKWPPTYSEWSKSGSGVHLHYIYDGDVEELDRVYSDRIEIKVFTGHSALRRKLTKCNNVPVATISSGLPIKEKKMTDVDQIKSEKGLRSLIERNLQKDIHPGTKPSIDFIKKILDEAYESDMRYDVTDMRSKIIYFANNSTNNALYCLKQVQEMKFKSEEVEVEAKNEKSDEPIAFFDVEVFPNLFVVAWKYEGKDNSVITMINPKPSEIEQLLEMKLVGFNCRRYDNHILYARFMGYTNEELYKLSQKLISNNQAAYFGEAYDLSYVDVYDFSTKKASLKRFQLDLDIHHQELGMAWDKPVDVVDWQKVADYCGNDVITTEEVFLSRKDDFVARQILADISGLPINSTTQKHTAKIIFGDDREPMKKFNYTKLDTQFPGYVYEMGKSTYRGETVGEGGYVYAEPGMYTDVALLDISSMHPTSIDILNLFGPYTKNFTQLMDARIAIKHGDLEKARGMFGGKLKPYLKDGEDSDKLAYALKIAINIVYGLTSASFENKFRDPRNVDNIVAKRGALFMIDLKHAVQEKGFTVAHIKTDSIKIPNATPEIIQFVMDFGAKYGYSFEHEDTYSKFCLVNDAVYIAKTKDGVWSATGAQFAVPYVFKKLFSHEPLTFNDLCEIKTVTTALYLDFDTETTPMHRSTGYHFVGKGGSFCPIKENRGGGLLLREKEGKYYAAAGTKGYRWMESDQVRSSHKEDDIDLEYFETLVEEAVEKINKFGDFEWFVSDEGENNE